MSGAIKYLDSSIATVSINDAMEIFPEHKTHKIERTKFYQNTLQFPPVKADRLYDLWVVIQVGDTNGYTAYLVKYRLQTF